MNSSPKRRSKVIWIVIGLGIFVLAGYRIFQDMHADPSSVYGYAFIFAVMAIFIALLRSQNAKKHILKRRWLVRILGVIVAGAGVAVVVRSLAKNIGPTPLLEALSLGPIYVGFMIAMLPTMIRFSDSARRSAQ